MKYLSIVLPVFNEEEILGDNLKKLVLFLKKFDFDWEIVVVDDGSKDKSSKIVESFRDKRLVLVRLNRNMGKGYALKEGVLNSRGRYVIVMDADLSVPLKFIKPMINKLKRGHVVIGSRREKDSKILKHQPLLREFMGRAYTFMARIISGVRLKDFTCGFKGFDTKTARLIFGKSVISRWSYDTEIIFLARKFGFKIQPLPVEWLNRENSRVRLGKDTITSFIDLLRIRVNDLKGIYD